jgi:hypothetical protein
MIVPRLQSAVARVLPAIEATVTKLAAGPTSPREMEQAARMDISSAECASLIAPYDTAGCRMQGVNR